MKLLSELLGLLFDARTPLIFKGLIAFALLLPLFLIGKVLRKALRFLADRSRWQRRARKHRWTLVGTGNFRGTLAGGQDWVTHAQGGDDRPNWLSWEAASLQVAPTARIHLIARDRFRRERDRIRAETRRVAEKNAHANADGPWGDSLLAKVGVGLMVAAVSAALDSDSMDLGSGSGNSSPLPRWAKLGLEPWPLGSDAFQSRFVVLADDGEGAGRMLNANAQALLLSAERIDPDGLTVDLNDRRLDVRLDPASVNLDRMEHLCLLGIALAEGLSRG